jgi:hypothetical protein
MKQHHTANALLCACTLLCSCALPAPAHPHVSGTITGRVVDAQGRPIAGAIVRAIYMKPFVVLIPPVDNHFVSAETKTRDDGSFTLIAHRADLIDARAPDWRFGELQQVSQTGNLIVVRKSSLPKPFTLRPGEKPPPHDP